MRFKPAGLAIAIAALGLTAPPQAAALKCSGYSYDSGGHRRSGYPNDPLFPKQWGLTQIKAPAAWARGAKGGAVRVAVVDSGVDLSHPDLSGRFVSGIDLVKGGGSCKGPRDENGHGTHVAGIIAADTNNGIGVAGTAPGAKIMPVRVLEADGTGSVLTANKGIRWAADHGARVINLSLGDQPLADQTSDAAMDTEKAVAHAWSKGAVVVAAAGNDITFPTCDYPAASKYAVCVAATDQRGLPAAYSNLPNDPDGTVGVRAPGGDGGGILFCEYDGDIWSTIWPGDTTDDCGSISGYDTLVGTSMSAPYVSGVAAMLAAKGLSNGQILQCLRTKSSNDGAFDPAYGYGIVDADAATRSCSRSHTLVYHPATGSTSPPPKPHKKHLQVSVRKTSREQLARTGELHVTVRSDRAVTVELRALVRRGGHTLTGAKKSVRLSRRGKRGATLHLSKKARNQLKKSGPVKVTVRYKAGKTSGTATPGR